MSAVAAHALRRATCSEAADRVILGDEPRCVVSLFQGGFLRRFIHEFCLSVGGLLVGGGTRQVARGLSCSVSTSDRDAGVRRKLEKVFAGERAAGAGQRGGVRRAVGAAGWRGLGKGWLAAVLECGDCRGVALRAR